MSDDGKVRRCLVVDDNVFAADIMTIFFRRYGIECDVAENGQDGLRFFMQNPDLYDVIFVDMQMPVMNGFDMMKCIRGSGLEAARRVRIVAMSGTITEDMVGEDRFNHHLKKPFELQTLLTVIHT